MKNVGYIDSDHLPESVPEPLNDYDLDCIRRAKMFPFKINHCKMVRKRQVAALASWG